MTDYVVLSLREGAWVEKGLYAGRTPRKAVEAAMAALPDELGEGGKLLAVPYRSFNTVTVTPETKTTLKFS